MATKAGAARLGALVVLLLPSSQLGQAQQGRSPAQLLRQFEGESSFWRQFQVAQAIVAGNDASILPNLEPWLTHQDRHLRGNAAFIFGRFGDSRGFDTIVAILGDRSGKRAVWKISSAGTPDTGGQITEDRYYAAHLLGDLKDPRAIPILIPLLKDPEVRDIVPWSLGQIGNRSAIEPLIGATSDPDPNMRVIAIDALVELKATEALPRLRQLVDDNARSNFGKPNRLPKPRRLQFRKLQ